MNEYFVIRREKCPHCNGRGSTTIHPFGKPEQVTVVPCVCKDGYDEGYVPLTDALAGDPVVRGCLRSVLGVQIDD